VTPALRIRTDEHLVKLFRAGREDAFEAIHDRHARRLHAAAARALRTHGGDPEGVVQEAFLRAHHALQADERPVELKPWLHRIVRNLCLDELRRARPVALEDEDRVPSTEDVYSTLSRRHELRALIDDLADLPEQQRAALLMRELDGLSHEEVAGVLDVTPQASRQLVKRARVGLNAAAEARDAACTDIREDLLTAHDEKRRPSEHAIRHLKRCSACREFRDGLKATRTRLRALVPPLGLGPLGSLLGGGATTKLAAGACCAVLAAGGAAAWVAGQHKVIRGTSPATEPGGKSLIGKPIRSGTSLGSKVAIATLTVRVAPGVRAVAHVTCPAGMGAAGLAQPRAQDGSVATGSLRAYQYSNRDVAALRHGGRHTAAIIYKGKADLPAPVVLEVGTLCKRR
jgi:RNA polymerase sigma factor (sigma-70 family)